MSKRRSRLTTVSVPPQFEPLFLKAQEAVERYFGDRVEDPEHSTLSYSGERYVLVRAASLSVEFFDVVAKLYADRPDESREVARNLLYDIAHSLGKSDADAFAKRMDLRDPNERLSAGPVHFSFAGWAFVDIHVDSVPSPNDDFFLHYDHPFSFESDAWLKSGKKADFPVCVMNAGYSSGWCAKSYGLPLAAVEVECIARGDPRCRFLMAPPNRLAAHVERVVGPSGSSTLRVSTTIPEFFQRKRVDEERQAALQESEARLRFITDNLPNGMVYQLVMDPSGQRRFTYLSAGVLHAHGLTREQIYADPNSLYGQLVEEDRARVFALEEESSRTLSLFAAEARYRLPSGTLGWRMLRSAPRRQPDGSTIWDGVEIDITEQKRAELEHAKFEERMGHRQRMESIGQLAGGVAHDFNNLLTVISGNLALALEQLVPGTGLHDGLTDASAAAAAAANLTRQLLAFSRKQAIAPRVLDLNESIEGLQTMLRRLLREDVALRLDLARTLGAVRGDPGMVEQILVNLVVNASDALPEGGTVTITTRNQTVDAAFCRERLDLAPGEHVVLSVSDDGTGMTEEVKAHAFEPFFTTKPTGKGTGLGLAMVYGAVKQAGGAVDLESEPAKGTTITIFLPRVDEAVDQLRTQQPLERARATENLILVEDDEMVRAFALRVLRQRGYHVLDYPDGPTALTALRNSSEPVHLLVTDVVMPGMNGRILAERLIALRPGLKVLFTSGYPRDALTPSGVLDPGTDLLSKPYTPDALVRYVRELLDRDKT